VLVYDSECTDNPTHPKPRQQCLPGIRAYPRTSSSAAFVLSILRTSVMINHPLGPQSHQQRRYDPKTTVLIRSLQLTCFLNKTSETDSCLAPFAVQFG
jgi:hypothetical protein